MTKQMAQIDKGLYHIIYGVDLGLLCFVSITTKIYLVCSVPYICVTERDKKVAQRAEDLLKLFQIDKQGNQSDQPAPEVD